MAKGRGGQRRVPQSPPAAQGSRDASAEPEAGPTAAQQEFLLTPSGYVPLPDVEPTKPRELDLIRGTGCIGGHDPATQQGETQLLGDVPSAKTTWIGVVVIGWCLAGLLFLAPGWLPLAFLLLLGWWAFSFGLQRRAGHRGRCLHVRAWRRAWGGLVPQGKDPTRPADGEDDD